MHSAHYLPLNLAGLTDPQLPSVFGFARLVKMCRFELPVLHQHRGVVALRFLVLRLLLDGIRNPQGTAIVPGIRRP